MPGIGTALEAWLSEFRARYSNRFYGKYRAEVTSNQDPEQLGRIKVTCPALFAAATTGWCWPAAPFGGIGSDRQHGMPLIPEVGDMVWIEFEEGNTNRPPIYTGMAWSTGALPDHVRAIPDESDEDGVKGIDGAAIPPSSFNATEYADVRLLQMPSGNRIEFDETEGGERIQIHHRSGGHIEILPDGTINIGAGGAVRMQSTAGGMRFYSAEDWDVLVDGSAFHDVQGSLSTLVGRSHDHFVNGDYNFSSATGTFGVDGDWVATFGTLTETVFGKETRQVSSQSSTMVGTDWTVLATQKAKLIAQNSIAVGGLFTDLALELKAQNGRVVVESTDETGFLSSVQLELNGGDPTGATVGLRLAATGPSLGGSFEVDAIAGLASVNADVLVQLGGVTAIDPLLKTSVLMPILAAIMILIDTHIHTSTAPGTPTSPPVVPPATTAGWDPTTLSYLSTKVFTE